MLCFDNRTLDNRIFNIRTFCCPDIEKSSEASITGNSISGFLYVQISSFTQYPDSGYPGTTVYSSFQFIDIYFLKLFIRYQCYKHPYRVVKSSNVLLIYFKIFTLVKHCSFLNLQMFIILISGYNPKNIKSILSIFSVVLKKVSVLINMMAEATKISCQLRKKLQDWSQNIYPYIGGLKHICKPF